jgi:hypothetical protein
MVGGPSGVRAQRQPILTQEDQGVFLRKSVDSSLNERVGTGQAKEGSKEMSHRIQDRQVLKEGLHPIGALSSWCGLRSVQSVRKRRTGQGFGFPQINR